MDKNKPENSKRQLHPKSVYLFFVSYFLAFYITILIPFFVILQLIAMAKPKDFNFMIIIKSFFIFHGTSFLISIPLAVIFARLAYRNWLFEFGEDTFNIEKGVIWKKYIAIPYERIQNIDIIRGPLARLLGISGLHIQTAGASGQIRYEGSLPGLSTADAEKLRDQLIKKSKEKQRP